MDALGLGRTDWLAYQMWLRNPAWSVGRVAKEICVTEKQAAESLERLLCKGILVHDRAAPGRLLPVGASDVVERQLAEIKAQAARRQQEVLQARDELSALQAFHLAERVEAPVLDIERVHNRSAITLRIDELVRTARSEILLSHTGTPAYCEFTGSCRVLRPGAVGPEVTVCALYEHRSAANPLALEDLAELTEMTGQFEIRTTGQAEGWSMVVDRKTGVVPADEDEAILVIRNRESVKALTRFLLHLRSAALPIAEPTLRECQPDDGPTDRDRLLLQLLSLGIKDEAISRHMGVSVRSVRRQISALFELLDATSRFQAGVQAARRGWL